MQNYGCLELRGRGWKVWCLRVEEDIADILIRFIRFGFNRNLN